MNPLAPFEAAIGWLLAFFYSFIPNLGISIILLTCTVMAILLPLTAKQTRSMIAMQRIQPEIKKIQQQYKDDRQKQNEELMRFYQENNVNPLSGCLPLIVQMPVLFALFRVLRDIQDHIPTTGAFNDLFVDICGTKSPAACNPTDIMFLGMDLTVAPSQSTGGFLARLPYFLAVAAVVASGWYQLWQTQARQKRMGSAMQNNPINKQMQMISRVFPIVFGWFSYIAASGLVVYFVTSSLWRIGQQHLVLNKYYEEHPGASGGGGKQKPSGGADAGKGPKPLPPTRPAGPASTARNGPSGAHGTNGEGVRENGANARSQPSPHASRKKRKRRR